MEQWLLQRLRFFSVLLLLASVSSPPLTSAGNTAPRLLLSASRLRRLGRDRTRQTERWANLDQRVERDADSPERGFELALFYAVTGDTGAADQAIGWASSHPQAFRQIALIVDWCGDRLSSGEREALLGAAWDRLTQTRVDFPDPMRYRDLLFLSMVRNGTPPPDLESWWNRTMALVNERGWQWLGEPERLYALEEIITVVRDNTRLDLRANYAQRFEILPTEYLLSLHPAEVAAPSWQTRAAALAVIDVDPNLSGSQFLQGWAMEDPGVIRSGPGVAYEFLWANAYLPGLSYYNLDPWSYDPDAGVLYVRSSWERDACWIRLDSTGVAEENCPEGWRERPVEAGHLSLIRFSGVCIDVPSANGASNAATLKTTILWGAPPGMRFTYRVDKKVVSYNADRSGLLRVPVNGEDRICPTGAGDSWRHKH